MQQIVDLQQDPTFQQLGVQLISVTVDPVEQLVGGAAEYGVTTPLLSDTSKQVPEAYDVMQWATPGGEPGHTFILVDGNGRIAWIRDYGAPENGGTMYVPVDELTAQIQENLNE